MAPKSIALVARIGGYYTSKDKDGTYGVWRLLDINEAAIHYTMFDTKFDHRPSYDEAKNAHVFSQHIPQQVGMLFLADDLTCLGGDLLTAEDLYGYGVYLEAHGDDRAAADDRIRRLIKLSRGYTFLRITETPSGPNAVSIIEPPVEERDRELEAAGF